jgi:hypothetical protein
MSSQLQNLSNQFNNITIYDLGTSFGHSAVAASINKSNISAKDEPFESVNIPDVSAANIIFDQIIKPDL